MSVVGALIIVLHAPEDKEVTSIDELLFYALRPGKHKQIKENEEMLFMCAICVRFHELLCDRNYCQLVYDL